MSNEAIDSPDGPVPAPGEAVHGAVVVGVVPGVSARVYVEAARYARLLGVPLAVVHVDVTRFIAFEDPDGYVHASVADIETSAAQTQLHAVEDAARRALGDAEGRWSVHQVIGDPAIALKHFADTVDAPLLVVGTRRRGLGESIREFFTGSVAARLTHRQHRPVLVVPLGEPVPDDQEIDWGA